MSRPMEKLLYNVRVNIFKKTTSKPKVRRWQNFGKIWYFTKLKILLKLNYYKNSWKVWKWNIFDANYIAPNENVDEWNIMQQVQLLEHKRFGFFFVYKLQKNFFSNSQNFSHNKKVFTSFFVRFKGYESKMHTETYLLEENCRHKWTHSSAAQEILFWWLFQLKIGFLRTFLCSIVSNKSELLKDTKSLSLHAKWTSPLKQWTLTVLGVKFAWIIFVQLPDYHFVCSVKKCLVIVFQDLKHHS